MRQSNASIDTRSSSGRKKTIVPVPKQTFSVDKVFEYLENVRILEGVPFQDLQALARYCEVYDAPKGAMVVEEGSQEIHLVFLVSGTLDVHKGVGAETRRVATIMPGTTVGEMGLLDGYPHSATLVSSKDAVIVRLPKERFEALVESNPRLGFDLTRRLARQLSLRLRRTTGQLAEHID